MYKTYEEYRIKWDEAYQKDPPIPLNVDIELAALCNAKCSFCLYGDRDWFAGMGEKDWDDKPKRRFMPKEMALQIIGDCAVLGVPALKINFRGESVLHPDYSEILRVARRYGPHGGMGWDWYQAFHEILVNTNGNAPDSAIEGLMAATKVMVSLDSMDPEIYPKVRVGLSLEKAQATIDELVRRGHPDLWVRRVICQDNKHEDFVGAVKKRWPSGVKVSEHYAFDRNHYQNESIHGEDFKKWPRTYCGYPSQRVVIDASGRYVPCCIAWEGEFDKSQEKPMRYPETSIKQYWQSEWRKNLANELRAGVFKNDKCKNCTSFMSYARPEREFVKDVAK